VGMGSALMADFRSKSAIVQAYVSRQNLVVSQ
jgi:hypothetical protein